MLEIAIYWHADHGQLMAGVLPFALVPGGVYLKIETEPCPRRIRSSL